VMFANFVFAQWVCSRSQPSHSVITKSGSVPPGIGNRQQIPDRVVRESGHALLGVRLADNSAQPIVGDDCRPTQRIYRLNKPPDAVVDEFRSVAERILGRDKVAETVIGKSSGISERVRY